MRKKLWFAVLFVTILSVAAGAHVVSGLSAQDPPKKDTESKKDDWYETLKKALEAKKDTAPAVKPDTKPTLELPPFQPTQSDDKAKEPTPLVPPPLPPMPVVPPMKVDKPIAPPMKDDKPITPAVPLDPIPAPTKTPDLQVPMKDNAIPIQGAPPKPPEPSPLPTFSDPDSQSTQAKDKKPQSPVAPLPPQSPLAPLPNPAESPNQFKDAEKPKKDLPAPLPIAPPPQDGSTLPKKDPPPADLPPKLDVPRDIAPKVDSPSPPPTVRVAPNPISEQVAKLKDCPWSLHVEIVDGQTIMTATVHKKHEFKIVCRSVDLQTGKSMLKATGKVHITSDMMSGNCENLSIPLMEDRLVMEGAASVSIQKMLAAVADEKVASFELKGASLDLRISEIAPAKLVQQASWQTNNKAVEVIPVNNPAPALNDGKKWTPYGRLMPAKIVLANETPWGLVGNDGNVIAYVVARDGGSLHQFEGQRISVLGTNVQINGRTFLRVTHVALP